jgi:hypothetical protein
MDDSNNKTIKGLRKLSVKLNELNPLMVFNLLLMTYMLNKPKKPKQNPFVHFHLHQFSSN